MKNILNIGLFFVFTLATYAQDDLLNEIDTVSVDKTVSAAFKSLKIVNLESTKLAAKGDFYFVVSHRFDYVKNGFDDFFGLDNANTRLQFVYGLTPWLNVQASRSGFNKTYEFAGKYSLMHQVIDGFPFEIVGFNSLAINTALEKELLPLLAFKDRLSYVTQLLVSRKFNEKLSLEVAPTFFHENYVVDDNQDNSQFALGFGGRYKLTSRWSLNIDYAAHLNRASNSPYTNPLSIGFDLETGGHVFQMHFTNSLAMHEAGFLGSTSGKWNKGEIAFGFNLVRVF
jgi:opacity protein-like surface antigen